MNEVPFYGTLSFYQGLVQTQGMYIGTNKLIPQTLENTTCQWQLCQQILTLTSKSWP